jgi:transposase
MYVRELKNRSGSISIQIISKHRGKYKVIKTVGSATQLQEIKALKQKAYQEIEEISRQTELFDHNDDKLIEGFVDTLSNSSILTVGPELVFGKIFDHIGFGSIKEELFRHLVIARLAYPLSKLKTTEYLYRYQGLSIEVDSIYRFLDKLSGTLKDQVEQIAFDHTKRLLKGTISVVFYDMTTLYFEASDEDDLRKTGFSKDGKHQNPQIFIGLLVAMGGYAIGYDIYEGNTYEGHTLIPFIEKTSRKFNLGKPVVIADSGLLSKPNIQSLEDNGYEYILGARLKNETESIKSRITSTKYSEGTTFSIRKDKGRRLIVNYSEKRATKDAYNRKRGLKRLEKRIKSGKLTKSNINNRGYNKYLKLHGDISIEVDYNKFRQDEAWDGIKGYLTNTKLNDKKVIENYNNLWHIEKAFRMSKTDLRIRPVYHYLKKRIEAHICISFVAYTIYKDLEKSLKENQASFSLKKAAEITHNIYQIDYQLPRSKKSKSKLLQMNQQQKELIEIIKNNY